MHSLAAGYMYVMTCIAGDWRGIFAAEIRPASAPVKETAPLHPKHRYHTERSG